MRALPASPGLYAVQMCRSLEGCLLARACRNGGQWSIHVSPRHLQWSQLWRRISPACGAVQEEGQFMVTFPCAYHGGFNQGFNCAEAVNFAPADWLRFGAASTERYRSFRKPSVVSHEQLLMKVSLRPGSQLPAGAADLLPCLGCSLSWLPADSSSPGCCCFCWVHQHTLSQQLDPRCRWPRQTPALRPASG